jgi:hypothetical protein
MHQLDVFDRPTPSSIEISRAAARRHEHLAALDSAGRPARRALPWSGLPASWARLVGSRPRAVVHPVRTARPTQVR